MRVVEERAPDAGTLVDSMTDADDKVDSFRLDRGTSVDRYVVLYELGLGGMGVVYAAYDPELDRKVALKLINAENNSERAQARLLREAKAIARLTHPNVVTVYDVGTFEGRVFVAMEFVDGNTLRSWVRRTSPPWTEILAVMRQAAEGLAAAHREDLIHRDFKPDNVLVDRHGRVVVLDFGLARRAGLPEHPEPQPPPVTERPTRLDAHLTKTGARLGTPAYMAPEQHSGLPTDARADQFAFCVVTWEALYGVRPFDVVESDSAEGGKAGLPPLRRPPRDTRVPLWVRRSLERGLSIDPDLRYESMQALLAALSGPPRRRRQLVAVGSMLSVLAGGLLLWPTSSPHPDPSSCIDVDDDPRSLWNDAARSGVRSAFAGSGIAVADELWPRVEQGIDLYVERWAQESRQACQSQTVSASDAEPKARHEGTRACLESSAAQISALLDVLADADAGTVTRALEAIGDLPPPEDCGSGAWNLHVDPDPGRLATVRTHLHAARAQLAAGRLLEALDGADRVLKAATRLSARGLAAEAQLVRAAVLGRRGRFEAQERALFEVIWGAEAVGRDDLVVQAWVDLVWVSGVERRRPDLGHTWAGFARAALERGLGSPALHAELDHDVGTMWSRQGRYDEAIETLESALEQRRGLYGDTHPAVATTMLELGRALTRRGRYEGARALLQQALDVFESTLGPHHPSVPATLTALGDLWRARGELDRSLGFARRAMNHVARPSDGFEYDDALSLYAELLIEREDWDAALEAISDLRVLRSETGGRPGEGVAEATERLDQVERSLQASTSRR